MNLVHNFHNMIEIMDNNISLVEAWSTICMQYPLLCKCFYGLASVFPGKSTVESDFLPLDMKDN
jgi:hypothetical protein